MPKANGPKVTGALPGPKSQAILERERLVASPTNSRNFPTVIERGEGVWLHDVDGNTFLDMMAGIAVNTTGYAHPKIVAAVAQQAGLVQHTCYPVFATEPQITLSERLNQKLGGGHKVFYGNSGTEGIEAAMKLARYHTRRPYFIAFTGSFHGRSMGALSLTASTAKYRKGFGHLVPGVQHLPFPNPYRHPHASDMVLSHLEYLFKHTTPADEVAAIILEPIQGEGGYIVPPDGFLRQLQSVCEQHGILLVLDEVQSGVGRTGQFLACEHEGVQPDIVVMAKGLASGYPLSAVAAKNHVASWGMGAHGTTFGGNPVSVAAAHATLDLLEEGLQDNASTVGAHLMRQLQTLQQRFWQLGDVRGRGLMIGLEFVGKNKQPDATLRDAIVQHALRNGVMLLGAGDNSVRLAPPLIVTTQEADMAVAAIEAALEETVAAIA